MTQEESKTYIAIDLKSFYASVECMERGLDPLTANLVVADVSRTEKTICLAVSPSLKSFGIPGRARLFEVVQKVKQVNAERLAKAPGHRFTGSSANILELQQNPSLELSYIAARPQMAHYIDISTRIYNIYLRYVAPEDIHVYSIDEVFIDATAYLKTRGITAREFAMMMIRTVLEETRITATAGIGTNLYLCKVAMDIVAKHIPADKDGVRIAELDEMSYRRLLWNHRPLTDFWRVGRGISAKLEQHGMYTMGDVARCSLGRENEFLNEELLYKLFGINAQLLIDHAWGWEPTTIAHIKAYKPQSSSLSSGQVLSHPYTFENARIVVREMIDLTVLDLVEKKLLTDQVGLYVMYDTENLADPRRAQAYRGEVTTDWYGRKVPKQAHGSVNLGEYSSSTKQITEAVIGLYDRIVDPNLLVRRINISVNRLIPESQRPKQTFEQLDLFTDYEQAQKEKEQKEQNLLRERRRQEAILAIREKYGKNSLVKGMNLQPEATAIERNGQIGGHRA